MITYLPPIYPDELVYSWFSRYYIHAGCLTHKMALQEILYKRCNNPSKEFIGHLNPNAEMIINQLYNMDVLIIHHTMFPQYARFLPPKRKSDALKNLLNDDPHHLLTILPRSEADRNVKYCPVCVAEDRERYGEAYWHRTHQIRNMLICSKHKCRLIASDVPTKSELSFTLSPAELSVKSFEPEYESNPIIMSYADYLCQIFNTPLDLFCDIPIRAVLYRAMKGTKYLKPSGKTRYTQQLAKDVQAFYKNIGAGEIATMTQIQRVLLGDGCDFTVVCQLAYFFGVGVNDLLHPNISISEIQTEKESHFVKNAPPMDWGAYDEEMAPQLARLANDIYTGNESIIGRPERVSEKMIYRKLGLPSHRLDNLPKCRAVMNKYQEPYAEAWARRLIWAYKKLTIERKGEPIYWSDLRVLSGVKKHHISDVIPYLAKHTDTLTSKAIVDAANR